MESYKGTLLMQTTIEVSDGLAVDYSLEKRKVKSYNCSLICTATNTIILLGIFLYIARSLELL